MGSASAQRPRPIGKAMSPVTRSDELMTRDVCTRSLRAREADTVGMTEIVSAVIIDDGRL